MSTSSVPAIKFTPAGLVVPDESAILAGVQADQNAAFGGNLNPALSTPQGQLASSTAAIIAAHNALFARFVQQVDPATASGAMQDAIGRIYFLDRLPATPTTVQVLCNGLAGVVIPAGALVVDSSGNRYACTGAGVIGADGNVPLTFAAVNTGPITCAPGAINAIYQAIPGWDTATNTAAGVTGSDVESRADFEYRRKQSVALNAVGSLPSIYASVFAVPGVSDVYVAENTTSTAVTIGPVTLVPHSIYVAATGGLAADIAGAIWRKKSVGAGYNGNTTVTVIDDSGYSIPRPSYKVKFQIPDPLPVKFAVVLAASAGLPADIVALVKGAIVSAFAGGDGGTRARIGSTIYASRFYAPIAAVAPVSIVSLLLGDTTPTLNALSVGIDRVPTVSVSDIVVDLA